MFRSAAEAAAVRAEKLESGHAPILIELFLAGRPEQTSNAYRRDLEAYALEMAFPNPSRAVNALLQNGAGAANAIGLAYRARLITHGLAPATINRRLASLRSLLMMAQRLELISWRLDVPNVRSRSYRDTQGPGDHGVQLLLQTANAQCDIRKSRRDVALIRLLHDLALRRGEVCRLQLADIDLLQGSLSVTGKGEVECTTIGLPGPTRCAIENWLDIRGGDPGPLFFAFDGAGRLRTDARLSGGGLWSILRTLGRRAGIEAWPHGLRHTAITKALEVTNGDLRKVQRFSRHRDVRAVLSYDDNRGDLAGTVASMIVARDR